MKETIFEKGTDTNRNLIALILIGLTIIAIIVISSTYLSSATDAAKKAETAEKIFNALLPMFATWVGTVLAFYFGRENFEAASRRYEQIITKLTPELLDDVLAEQIMIDTKTMVSMKIVDAEAKKVSEIITFMDSIAKSRLPIIDGDKIKYIVHKSTFLSAVQKKSNEEIEFKVFAEENKELISAFITVQKSVKLEKIIEEMKKQPNIKDVFVTDENGLLLGWITDTLIIQYIKK